MFWDMFQRMKIGRDKLKLTRTLLVGLVGHKAEPMGTIHLTLIVGTKPKCAGVDMS